MRSFRIVKRRVYPREDGPPGEEVKLTNWRQDGVVFVRTSNLDLPGPIVFTLIFLPLFGIAVFFLIQNPQESALWTMSGITFLFVFGGIIDLTRRLSERAKARRRLQAVKLMDGVGGRDNRQAIEALVNLKRFQRTRAFALTTGWNWRTMAQEVAAHGLAMPRCIAEVKLLSDISRIPRLEVLLEAEPLRRRSEGDAKVTWTLLLGGIVITSALLFFRGGYCWASVLVILNLIAICELGWNLHRSGRAARHAILAPGFLVSDRDVWSASESVTFIKERGNEVFVELIALDRRLSFRFAGSGDAFTDFWQRWMHPHPRPELVQGIIESTNHVRAPDGNPVP